MYTIEKLSFQEIKKKKKKELPRQCCGIDLSRTQEECQKANANRAPSSKICLASGHGPSPRFGIVSFCF